MRLIIDTTVDEVFCSADEDEVPLKPRTFLKAILFVLAAMESADMDRDCICSLCKESRQQLLSIKNLLNYDPEIH